MPYDIKGEYVVTCNCQLLCPCSVDGPPTAKDGVCHGAQVLHIAEGSLDGVDLAGVDVGMVYLIPGNITGGNWTVALALDPKVSDAQVGAVEKIFKGEVGGPFAEFAPLIGTFQNTERVPITYTPGKDAKATIGKGGLDFSPLLGGDGNPTTVKNSMFGFAPEYEVGKGTGKVDTAGVKFDAIYGEHAQFQFAG